MYQFLGAIGLAVSLLLSTGCSVVMASKQPEKKNTAMIQQGLSRNLVIAEFGAPITSEYKNGKRYEVYTFRQGYSTVNKISRAFWHGAADVATAGLWELIGTPAETVFNGQKTSYEMVFDTNDQLESHKRLSLETEGTVQPSQ